MGRSEFSFEESIGGLLGRSSKMMGMRLMRRFRQNGPPLTIEQMVVLIHLWEQDGRTQQELCKRAKHHKTKISRALSRLETLNMVLRVPDQQDGRIRRIYLTSLGKSIREKIIPHASTTVQEAIKGIDPDELAICKGVLRKILQNLHQLENS